MTIHLGDALAGAAKLADVFPARVLRAKAMPHFEELVAASGDAMRREMAAHLVTLSDRDAVARRDADDLDVVFSVLELRVQRHQRAEIIRRFARHENSAAGNAL